MVQRCSERRLVHLTVGDVARLEALAARLPLRPAALLRELFRVGADAVEQDPARLLRGAGAA